MSINEVKHLIRIILWNPLWHIGFKLPCWSFIIQFWPSLCSIKKMWALYSQLNGIHFFLSLMEKLGYFEHLCFCFFFSNLFFLHIFCYLVTFKKHCLWSRAGLRRGGSLGKKINTWNHQIRCGWGFTNERSGPVWRRSAAWWAGCAGSWCWACGKTVRKDIHPELKCNFFVSAKKTKSIGKCCWATERAEKFCAILWWEKLLAFMVNPS